jgi:ABC-type transporter Mla subunit MlaD
MNPTQQEVHDAFDELNQALTNAAMAATGPDQDNLREMADEVFDIVTALNQADIQSRTQDFAALKQKVDTVTQQLTNLQNQIDSIIHDVSVASGVVGAIGKALSSATTFFA